MWELYEPCTHLDEHVEKMKKCPYWEKIRYIKCDPSIFYKNQMGATGLHSIAEQFRDKGVILHPGRKGADVPVALKLAGTYWGDPDDLKAFITDACPNLRNELRDLRWEEHRTEAVRLYKNRPEKIRDKKNHAFDASAYILDVHLSGETLIARSSNVGAPSHDNMSLDWAVKRLERMDRLSKLSKDYINA